VIPITESYGLWHPQEGVVNGHFLPSEASASRKWPACALGVKKVVEDERFTPSNSNAKFVRADLITGWGVGRIGACTYYRIYGGAVAGKASLCGWGNVGSAAAYTGAAPGAKVVGIIDRDGGLLNAPRLQPLSRSKRCSWARTATS
jgi:glutamate dehydrogenase (NAD(P)+)